MPGRRTVLASATVFVFPFSPLPWLPSTNPNESDPPNTQRRYRLINLVAEDNAIEDTIYHLHRALNTGRVDLERFLRVRASFLSVFCVSVCTCVWWVWVDKDDRERECEYEGDEVPAVVVGLERACVGFCEVGRGWVEGCEGEAEEGEGESAPGGEGEGESEG